MSESPALKHPAAKALREAALAYPGAVEDFPWGDRALKVGKKVFLFLGGNEEGGFSCSMKLPYRASEALQMKVARPTPYGLGKSGWVSFRFSAKARAPLKRLIDYLDESWRAIAPKKLSSAHPPPNSKRTP